MDASQLQRWVQMLPAKDRDIPAANVDGKWLSPNDMLREVQAGTELGTKVLNYLSTTHLGTEEEMLVERLKQRLSNYPQDKPLLITLNKNWTPAEILKEVSDKTVAGQQFLEKERQMLKYSDRLKERV